MTYTLAESVLGWSLRELSVVDAKVHRPAPHFPTGLSKRENAQASSDYWVKKGLMTPLTDFELQAAEISLANCYIRMKHSNKQMNMPQPIRYFFRWFNALGWQMEGLSINTVMYKSDGTADSLLIMMATNTTRVLSRPRLRTASASIKARKSIQQ
jgi:hypothetical protein